MRINGIRAMLKNRANRESIYSTAEYWDTRAKEESGEAASMWHNNNLNLLYHREIIDAIARFIPNTTGLRILDLGCGTGRISRHLANMQARVTGIDFSAVAIDIAKQSSSGDNPSYRVESMFDLREDSEYDVVISWGSITLACRDRSELLGVMRRLRAALKPGGTLLLLEPVHRGFLHRVLNMSMFEFREVIAEAGLRLKAVQEMHFWPARLLLAHVAWSKCITVALYHLGQWMMATPGMAGMGDYKAIFASADE